MEGVAITPNNVKRNLSDENLKNSIASKSGNTSSVSLNSLGNEFSGTSKRRCNYFASGNCRNGDNCRFSHELSSSQPVSPIQYNVRSPVMFLPPPPPVIVSIPQGHPIFSIDV